MKAALLAALAVLAVATAGCGGSRPRVERASPPAPPGRAKLEAIRQLVLAVAAGKGDPSPTTATIVPTTRRRAELVDLDTSERDRPVYFVLVRGEFTRGTLLTLTVDPRSTKLIDAGLVARMPDLNAIGTPRPLPLSGR